MSESKSTTTNTVTAAGATIGDLIPELANVVPGNYTSITVVDPIPSLTTSETKPVPVDTRHHVWVTPKDPTPPETITQDTVLHIDGGMVFQGPLPQGNAQLLVHVHSGSFVPFLAIGARTSASFDSGAMGILKLLEGGSAYVSRGGKVKFLEAGGYARCAKDSDVVYCPRLDDEGPEEKVVTSGNSMTLHGGDVRLRVENGGYAYLVGANYGYGDGDMPDPTPGSTEVHGEIKVLDACITEMHVMSGGTLTASDCCVEHIVIHSGGTAKIVKGSAELRIESGGLVSIQNAEIDSIRAEKGAKVDIFRCGRVFYRSTDRETEFFTVVGKELKNG